MVQGKHMLAFTLTRVLLVLFTIESLLKNGKMKMKTDIHIYRLLDIVDCEPSVLYSAIFCYIYVKH